MILELRLKNFKCFGNETAIQFAPITLIYGENSAGKSTILQALYALKQTVELARPSTPLLLNASRGYVQLGSFLDVIHNGATRSELAIGITTAATEHMPGYGPICALYEKVSPHFACSADGSAYIQALQQVSAEGELSKSRSSLNQFDPKTIYGGERIDAKLVEGYLQQHTLISDYNEAYKLHSENRDIMQRGIRLLCAQHALNSIADTPAGKILANNMWYHNKSIAIRAIDQSLSFIETSDLAVIYHDSHTGDCPDWLQDAARNGWRWTAWACVPYHIVWEDLDGRGLVPHIPGPVDYPSDYREEQELPELLFAAINSDAYKNAVSSLPARLLEAQHFYESDFSLGDYSERQEGHPAAFRWHPDHFMVSGEPEFVMALDDQIYNAGLHFLEYQADDWSKGGAWTNVWPKEPCIVLTDKRSLKVKARSFVTQECLREMRPIAPLRAAPQRVYHLTGEDGDEIGFAGEQLVEKLTRSPDLLKEVEEWANRIGLDYDFAIRRFEDVVANVATCAVRDRRNPKSPWVTLADVGAGVTQLLPILFNGLASKKITITIEQPELHVHPRLQAELGGFLAHAAKQKHNQFIVETHSEHLMLRIQRLIRKGDLKADDVSVLYVSRGEDGSTVQRLRLDTDGEFLDPWPNGFFPERAAEILGS